jgi:hypothetical protein
MIGQFDVRRSFKPERGTCAANRSQAHTLVLLLVSSNFTSFYGFDFYIKF